MAEFDKKIATEAEFFEIIKPFDDVPSELSNGICLRKDKISKYTEKTFDSLNDYTNNQLVPLATFVDVGNADYVLISFIWEGDGDLDCIVKTSNFDENYIGIGFGTIIPYENIPLYGGYKELNRRPNEIIQWSGDVMGSGGEYFLIDMKNLKEYKTKYGLNNKYFDFDVYAHWYSKPEDFSKNITLKVETIIADDAKYVEKSRFKFTNENITKVFEYNFDTKAILTLNSGINFLYDLVKQIRCFSSFATFLPNNFPKIERLENITKPPKIIVNGVDHSPIDVSALYDVFQLKRGDKIKIILYPYSFKKITIDENHHEQTLYKHFEIKDVGPFKKPSSDILTCNYSISDDGTEMTIDIDVINSIKENYTTINFNFLGRETEIHLYIQK